MNDQVNVSVCRSALLTNPHPLVALVVLLGLLEKLPLIAESLLVPLTWPHTQRIAMLGLALTYRTVPRTPSRWSGRDPRRGCRTGTR